MAEELNRELLGIVGGLGPLASAEFLKTIYECNLGEDEQHAPAVLMYSDPSFPDRTETFLRGEDDILLDRLIVALRRLCELRVSKVVICCITIHHVVPRLPPLLREKVVSLLDVIFASLARSRKKHLLVCTSGTRRMGIFERHEGWERAKDYLIWPDEDDQKTIHYDLIYRVKSNHDVDELMPLLESLLAKYEVDSFVAGCTEMHLLTKRFADFGDSSRGRQCIDPLTIIAQAVTGDELARLVETLVEA